MVLLHWTRAWARTHHPIGFQLQHFSTSFPSSKPILFPSRSFSSTPSLKSSQNGNMKLFIVAGEPSGDALGGKLLHSLHSILKEQNVTKPLSIQGIGGPEILKQGLFSSLFPMSDLSVMGFTEVIPHLPRLAYRMHQTTKAIQQFQPHVLLTIDSKGFNFRLLKRLSSAAAASSPPSHPMHRVHYVAPSTWAFRGAAEKAARTLPSLGIDHLLTLFPFERQFFEQTVGIKSTCVGHNSLEDYQEWKQMKQQHSSSSSPFSSLIQRNNPHEKTLCLMPGSRLSEVKRSLPIFHKIVSILSHKNAESAATVSSSLASPAAVPRVSQIVVPTLALGHENSQILREIQNHTRNWPIPTSILALDRLQRFDIMASSDAAMAASGTTSVELSLCSTPSIVIYPANRITSSALKTALSIKYASITNLLLGRKAIPEYLFEECTGWQQPQVMADHLWKLLTDDSDAGEAKQQKEDMNRAMEILASSTTSGLPRSSYVEDLFDEKDLMFVAKGAQQQQQPDESYIAPSRRAAQVVADLLLSKP